MHIKSIYIDNFKTFRKFKVEFNKDINVFTGTNNSGKTTVLEAISLWYECFRYLIKRADKSITSSGIRQGDYRLGNKDQNYIDYRKITAVRTTGYNDIFFNLNSRGTITISAIISVDGGGDLSIPFEITSANGNNYNIKLYNHDNFDFFKLNRSFTDFPSPILCIYASPIAFISTNEEFALEPKIIDRVTSRQSFLYLRNRIYRLLTSRPEYSDFKNDVSYILTGNVNNVDFQVVGNINSDIEVKVNVKAGARESYKDITLLGSGTLQIIELMLAIYERRRNINLILLDEPDSHIHRDIQKRLIEVLSRDSTNAQVFLTTHNESLIRSTKPKNIFHITNNGNGSDTIICKSIIHSELPRRRMGIMPSHHAKILRSIGDENSLDLINAIESHKLIFVEGDDDANNLQKILDIYGFSKDVSYWAFRGIDSLIQKISHYKEFLNGIGSNTQVWNKCLLVIDSDHMTELQLQQLKNDFENRLQIKTFIWSSYTIESTLLLDYDNLEELISRALISIGHPKEITEIASAINQTKEEIKNIKLHKLLNDTQYRESISGQINARDKNLTDYLDFNRVFSCTQINYFPTYEVYARQKLDANHIAHICNKDDVEYFFQKVFGVLGVSINLNSTYFDFILSISDTNCCPTEWTQFYSFVNQ